MKKVVQVGKIKVGEDAPVSVQSMLNCSSSDFNACSEQIKRLKSAGCDIIRLAISDDNDIECAKMLIKEFADVPLVADIQFDYRLAVKCGEIGFSKVRINPGNIGGEDKVRLVADACRANGVAIRVGVNGGSIEKELESKYGSGAKALSESALKGVALLERFGFYDIVVSAKSSSVMTTIETYRLINKQCDYPLHIGVTESGGEGMGNIKSAIGIGTLLADGIGNTIRVSLTGDPVKEVYAAVDILKALNLRDYCEVVSCPTCSRCHYDMPKLASEICELVKGVEKRLKIAVMGCVVNGPGEAKDADIGIAGGSEKAVIFEKGKITANLPFDKAVAEFKQKVGRLIADVC